MPGMGILESLGRGVSHLGSRKGSLLAIGAVAGLAGFAKKAGPAARDAVLDVGLGDPNADRYFTGSKFSGRSLLGAGIGGNLGTAVQMTNPGDFMRTHPMIPGPVPTGLAGGFAGGVLGTMAGGIMGAKKGVGGMFAGAFAGAALGAGVGTIAGMAVPAAAAMHYMKSDNPDFFSNSPYSQKGTRQMMNDLGASGDVVLGMHNSRRGY